MRMTPKSRGSDAEPSTRRTHVDGKEARRLRRARARGPCRRRVRAPDRPRVAHGGGLREPARPRLSGREALPSRQRQALTTVPLFEALLAAEDELLEQRLL